MSEENSEDVTDEQLAKQELDDEAAFEQGFGSDEAPETQIVEVNVEPEQAPEPEVTPEPEPTVLAGLTEAEVKQLFSRISEIDSIKQSVSSLHDKTFGTLGEYKTKLTELQENKPSGFVNLKPEQLKRLNEFEPELAELLAQDLSESLGSGDSLSKDSVMELINGAVQNNTASISRQYEDRLLHFAHPDVDAITSTPDWGTWVASQDVQTRQLLATSTDALELSAHLNNFKGWRDKSAKQAEKQNKRLESSLLPTDKTSVSPASSVSDEEAFIAGFENG